MGGPPQLLLYNIDNRLFIGMRASGNLLLVFHNLAVDVLGSDDTRLQSRYPSAILTRFERGWRSSAGRASDL